LYTQYYDGDLTLPSSGPDDDGPEDVVMDDQVSVEDIFEF